MNNYNISLQNKFYYGKKRRNDSLKKIAKRNNLDHLLYYGTRHTDGVVIAAFASMAIPVLLGILKAAVVGGLASAIADPIKRRVTEPIINRIVSNLKEIIASKGNNETYTQALWRGVKSDFRRLAEFLKHEASPFYPKVKALSDKAEQIK